MKLQQVMVTALVASTMLLAGCTIAPVTSGTGAEKLVQGDDFKKHLQVDNAELGKKLHISEVKSRKTNGLLEINLALTSSYKKSQQLQYHFKWFDKDGFVLEANKAPWKPLELHGFQTATVKGLAPSVAVESFSVYVREVPEKYYKF